MSRSSSGGNSRPASRERLDRLERIVAALVDAEMWLKPDIRALVEEIRTEHREAAFDREFVPHCESEGL